jgi:hypothetical protein
LRAFAIFEAPNPLRLHFAHLRGIYRSRPPLVDARGLGLGDPLKLALAPQIGLKLGEHAKHVQETFAANKTRVSIAWGSVSSGTATTCSFNAIR